MRLVDHYAPLVEAALDRVWSDRALRDAALTGSVVALGDGFTGDVARVLADMAAESWEVGRHCARLQLDAAPGGGAPVVKGFGPRRKAGAAMPDAARGGIGIDWDAWRPGDLSAARVVRRGGLGALLSGQGVTIRGIRDALLDSMGRVLARALDVGASVDDVAKELRAVFTPARAEMIAHTEIARAQTAGTLEEYAEDDVDEWEWDPVDEACPECVAAAKGGPYPVAGGPGVPMIPLHPRCRCAALPVLPEWDEALG
jgi:SPP1 gp7 family putative phage head morphogenesis protein